MNGAVKDTYMSMWKISELMTRIHQGASRTWLNRWPSSSRCRVHQAMYHPTVYLLNLS